MTSSLSVFICACTRGKKLPFPHQCLSVEKKKRFFFSKDVFFLSCLLACLSYVFLTQMEFCLYYPALFSFFLFLFLFLSFSLFSPVSAIPALGPERYKTERLLKKELFTPKNIKKITNEKEEEKVLKYEE